MTIFFTLFFLYEGARGLVFEKFHDSIVCKEGYLAGIDTILIVAHLSKDTDESDVAQISYKTTEDFFRPFCEGMEGINLTNCHPSTSDCYCQNYTEGQYTIVIEKVAEKELSEAQVQIQLTSENGSVSQEKYLQLPPIFGPVTPTLRIDGILIAIEECDFLYKDTVFAPVLEYCVEGLAPPSMVGIWFKSHIRQSTEDPCVRMVVHPDSNYPDLNILYIYSDGCSQSSVMNCTPIIPKGNLMANNGPELIALESSPPSIFSPREEYYDETTNKVHATGRRGNHVIKSSLVTQANAGGWGNDDTEFIGALKEERKKSTSTSPPNGHVRLAVSLDAFLCGLAWVLLV